MNSIQKALKRLPSRIKTAGHYRDVKGFLPRREMGELRKVICRHTVHKILYSKEDQWAESLEQTSGMRRALRANQ